MNLIPLDDVGWEVITSIEELNEGELVFVEERSASSYVGLVAGVLDSDGDIRINNLNSTIDYLYSKTRYTTILRCRVDVLSIVKEVFFKEE